MNDGFVNHWMEPATGRGAGLVGELVREGDYWTVAFDGREFRARHSKGIGYLAELLSRPGVPLSALSAAGSARTDPRGARGRCRLRERRRRPRTDPGRAGQGRLSKSLEDLQAERDEAEAFHDPERAERARAEYDTVAGALASALGLGGRDRRAGSPAERARVNVTRAIETAIEHLGEHDPALGEYLTASVMTGRDCLFNPGRASPVQWTTSPRPPNPSGQFEPPVTRYAESGGVSIAYPVPRRGRDRHRLRPAADQPSRPVLEDRFAAAFYRRLASFGRLIMFDKRDTGLSDSAPGEPSLFQQRIEDIEAVMEACAVEAGGPVRVFRGRPDEHPVRRHLSGAGERADPRGGVGPMGPAPDYPCGQPTEEMYAALRASPRTGGDRARPSGGTCPAGADGSAAGPARAVGADGGSPSALLRIVRMIRDVDVREVLPAIHVPTLVVQRLNDRITPRCHGRYLADHLRQARYSSSEGVTSRGSTTARRCSRRRSRAFYAGLAREEPEPDSVLATIVCAAGPLDADPDAVRRMIQANRGRLVTSAEGTVVTTFDSPARAIGCATALQDAASTSGIVIRVGVHAGEVDIRASDIAGLSSQVAACLATVAEPGEILASGIVRDLVVGSGIAFDDRGERELPGSTVTGGSSRLRPVAGARRRLSPTRASPARPARTRTRPRRPGCGPAARAC